MAVDDVSVRTYTPVYIYLDSMYIYLNIVSKYALADDALKHDGSINDTKRHSVLFRVGRFMFRWLIRRRWLQ